MVLTRILDFFRGKRLSSTSGRLLPLKKSMCAVDNHFPPTQSVYSDSHYFSEKLLLLLLLNHTF